MKSLFGGGFLLAAAVLLLAHCSSVNVEASTACYSDPETSGFPIPSNLLLNSTGYGVCKVGWYCPFWDPNNASNTWPRICPASDACLEEKINNNFCEPQGPFEPTPCRGGNYCPTTREILRCPKGYYCPIGSVEPKKCSPFAHCPGGTSNEYDMVGILLVVLLDISIVLGFLIYGRLYRQAVTDDEKSLKDEEMANVNPDVEEGKTTLAGSVTQTGSANKTANLQPLFSLFSKARGEGTSATFRFSNLSVKIPAADVSRDPSDNNNNAAEPSPVGRTPTTADPATAIPAASQPPSSGPQDKTLLRGVNGKFRPGTVTAIMGPSGAGKTVLLNTLLNKNASSWKQEGTLTVNNTLRVTDVRHVVGSVPQDDVLHPELTVDQNLFYSSETRLPSNFTPEDRALLRKEIVKVLGLNVAKHVRIGDESSRGVSGGQRKRCSIGVELAACPTALFLDEPTTGLDAATALDLCHFLQRLSVGTQSTVVMVVHQPRVEIWNALDQVLLLAPGGRTVYQGPQSEAKAYFESALGLNFAAGNPADIILDGVAAQADLAVEMWDARLQLRAAGGNVTDVVAIESNSAPPSHEPLNDDAASEEEPAVAGGGGGDRASDHNSDKQSPSANLPPLSSAIESEAEEEDTTEGVIPPPRGASFAKQVYLAVHRQLVKISTHLPTTGMEILLATICVIVMGTAKIREDYIGIVEGIYGLVAPKHKVYTAPMICMFYMLAIASGVASSGIRTFGGAMPQYWREASNGHNRLAYFLGYSFVDLIRTTVSSLHFATIAYLMAEPLQSFWMFWLWIWLVFICVDSQSAALSMFLKPDTAPILSTIVAIFMGLLNGYASIPVINPISYSWWATEAMMHGELWPVRNVWSLTAYEDLAPWNLNQVGLDAIVLCLIYLIYRLVAFLLLVGLNREKQR